MEDASKIEEVQNRIMSAIANSPVVSDTEHANRTLKWVLTLKPDADFALQIAALGHDIDRGISGITREKADDYKKASLDHALRSAGFIKDILVDLNFDEGFIKKVFSLVKNHEYGGDEESDILKDADTVAFFEYNIPTFFKDHGVEKTRLKIVDTLSRASDLAKGIINKFDYENIDIKELVDEVLKENE